MALATLGAHAIPRVRRAPDRRDLISSVELLALGSAILFGFGSVLLFGPFPIVVLAPAALFFHAWAWVRLGRWARRTRGTAALFTGSIAAFALGLATLPWTFPVPWYLPTFLVLIFPYIPTVFGPVVILHAALFLLASRDIPPTVDRDMVWVGSLFLGALGTVAMAVQGSLVVGSGTSPFYFTPLWSLAGLSSVGYALAGLGLRGGAPMSTSAPAAS